MDLTFTPGEEAFRQEVRAFIASALPADIKRKVENGLFLAKDDFVRWQKLLFQRGWIAPNWPIEYGGTGWSATQRYIFEEACAAGGAPPCSPFGLGMVAPILMKFGSDAQKSHYLPRVLSSEDWWCQGYSEPNAGSDLAALQTRAMREGDHYVVNGAKTWTTHAQYADMIFCLVRTDSSGKKQEGISFLLVDMDDPGVSVRPITTIDGGQEINEVWFDNVRVPAENLVGEEGKGWTYAKYLLGHERSGIAQVARSKKQIKRLKRIAGEELSDGAPLLDEPAFRDKLAALEIDLLALEYTELRILADENASREPGPETSILKIRGTEIQQAISALLVEAIGYYANPFVSEALNDGWNEPSIGPDYAAPLAPHYFNWRKASIYGGANEIQKNIIAKMVLGL